MPDFRFIADDKMLPAIYSLIEEAEEEIIIVSPYINLWGHLIDKLDKFTASKLFIARKNQDGKLEDVIRKMNERHLELRLVENLHAKIYLNEKRCLVSSMNLYDYSTANSREIGIIIEDKDVLGDINKYIDYDLYPKSQVVTDTASKKIAKGLKNIVGFVSTMAQKETPRTSPQTSHSAKREIGDRGYCIRCHGAIKNNPDKPLCPACYEKWKIFGNPAYKEKYCHICGKPEQTSAEKPMCMTCYKNSH